MVKSADLLIREWFFDLEHDVTIESTLNAPFCEHGITQMPPQMTDWEQVYFLIA